MAHGWWTALQSKDQPNTALQEARVVALVQAPQARVPVAAEAAALIPLIGVTFFSKDGVIYLVGIQKAADMYT